MRSNKMLRPLVSVIFLFPFGGSRVFPLQHLIVASSPAHKILTPRRRYSVAGMYFTCHISSIMPRSGDVALIPASQAV